MGTTCFLLWGDQCRYNVEERALECIETVENGGSVRVPIQKLQVLAYEAALLAGHKIDDESDDAVLARKNLLPIVIESTGEEEKKRKRAKEWTKLRKKLKIHNHGRLDTKKVTRALLGTELADRTHFTFGIDPSFNELDEPSPLFLYDEMKVKKAYGTSYQRNSVDWIEWKNVPNAIDRWAYFKIVRLLGLGLNEKPNLIISMFVPPHTSAVGGEEYDY